MWVGGHSNSIPSDARPNLIILNRQNMDNFSAPLEQLRDLHVEKDFLMFAHAAGTASTRQCALS